MRCVCTSSDWRYCDEDCYVCWRDGNCYAARLAIGGEQ